MGFYADYVLSQGIILYLINHSKRHLLRELIVQQICFEKIYFIEIEKRILFGIRYEKLFITNDVEER